MSARAGANFTPMNDGLGNLDVNCPALDPTSRLLAGTADGVYNPRRFGHPDGHGVGDDFVGVFSCGDGGGGGGEGE